VVPESVKKIEHFAFFNKGSLKQLIIEGIDVEIDDMALYCIPDNIIQRPGNELSPSI